MDPFTAAVGLGIGGDLLGAGISGAFNAREASKNRAWQEKMSNTAYQRAAVDLDKAGLNRVLALGSPASTPSGATSSISAPPLGKTGIAAASAKQAIDQSKAQEKLLESQKQLADEQKRLTAANADEAEFWKAAYDKFQPDMEMLLEKLRPGISRALDAGNSIQTIMDRLDQLENWRDGAWGKVKDYFNTKDTTGNRLKNYVEETWDSIKNRWSK